MSYFSCISNWIPKKKQLSMINIQYLHIAGSIFLIVDTKTHKPCSDKYPKCPGCKIIVFCNLFTFCEPQPSYGGIIVLQRLNEMQMLLAFQNQFNTERFNSHL